MRLFFPAVRIVAFPLAKRGLSTLVLVLLCSLRSGAATFEVLGADGSPVADAVISLIDSEGPRPDSAGTTAVMDQVDRAFVPHVLAIQTGTLVEFPNSDQIRHSIYSFSTARVFEIKLYKGSEAPPILFDRPGVVVLGCNIHDYMLSFVYVLDTPYSAVTAESGRARIDGLASGGYQLEVRHPRMQENVVHAQAFEWPATEPVVIRLPATPPPRPAIGPASSRYETADPLDALGDFP